MFRHCRVAAVLVLFSWLAARPSPALPPSNNPARWESAIAAFEASDKQSPPPKDGILFVGSSSIRLWDLKKHFPDLSVINRGFGGSQLEDSIHFAGRIVLPYEPRVIVLYAGDNDLAAGKSPEQVVEDFKRFAAVVHQKLPKTRIIYISIKPSNQRWKLIEKIRAANAGILEAAKADGRLSFVDVHPAMLGEDGLPRKELLVEDGLHLSPAGYEIWSKLVREKIE